jgi:hypothetical protein
LHSEKRNSMYGRFGNNHPKYGYCPSEKTKQKIREANIGTHHTEETKRKISESFKAFWAKKKQEEQLDQAVFF